MLRVSGDADRGEGARRTRGTRPTAAVRYFYITSRMARRAHSAEARQTRDESMKCTDAGPGGGAPQAGSRKICALLGRRGASARPRHSALEVWKQCAFDRV